MLSGTGLGIDSSFEVLSLSIDANIIPILIGPTNYLDAHEVADAVKCAGVTAEVPLHDAHMFQGRPRFAMQLANAMLMNLNLVDVIENIVNDLRLNLKAMEKIEQNISETKNVVDVLREVAIKWITYGEGGLKLHHQVSLEHGITTMDGKEPNLFQIKEPLVIKALGPFSRKVLLEYDGLTDRTDCEYFESHWLIRHVLNSIVLIIQQIADTVEV